MALHKAIKSGKEHRVEYGTKGQAYAKAVDRRCRNHGGRSGGSAGQCTWCLGNRVYKNNERERLARQEICKFRKGQEYE